MTKDDIIMTVQYLVLITVCVYFTYAGSPGVQKRKATTEKSILAVPLTTSLVSFASASNFDSKLENANSYVIESSDLDFKIGKSYRTQTFNHMHYDGFGNNCCIHGHLPVVRFMDRNLGINIIPFNY